LVLNSSLSEKEIEIVYDLAQRVLQYEDVLVEASDICGDMDRSAFKTHSLSRGF
jgi:DNA mismatch repair protein MSH5